MELQPYPQAFLQPQPNSQPNSQPQTNEDFLKSAYIMFEQEQYEFIQTMDIQKIFLIIIDISRMMNEGSINLEKMDFFYMLKTQLMTRAYMRKYEDISQTLKWSKSCVDIAQENQIQISEVQKSTLIYQHLVIYYLMFIFSYEIAKLAGQDVVMRWIILMLIFVGSCLFISFGFRMLYRWRSYVPYGKHKKVSVSQKKPKEMRKQKIS